jgi:hypothetical protein
MAKIDEFPVSLARKAPWEGIPRVKERVFDVIESLVPRDNKDREELTKAQTADLRALRDVFGELSTINHELVKGVSLACDVGKISYLEKVLLVALLLSVQRSGRGMELSLKFFSGDGNLGFEARLEIIRADFLSYRNRNFLWEMAERLSD